MENVIEIQLSVPWPQHLSWDFNNKGICDADASFGHAHLLNKYSQDSTVGKCTGFKDEQICIWTLALLLACWEMCHHF